MTTTLTSLGSRGRSRPGVLRAARSRADAESPNSVRGHRDATSTRATERPPARQRFGTRSRAMEEKGISKNCRNLRHRSGRTRTPRRSCADRGLPATPARRPADDSGASGHLAASRRQCLRGQNLALPAPWRGTCRRPPHRFGQKRNQTGQGNHQPAGPNHVTELSRGPGP